MSSETRTSSASTGSDKKPRSNDFSPLQKFIVVCVALSTLGGVWFFMSGQAASTIDVTLSPTQVAENLPALTPLNERDGLVGYWTLDSRDLMLGAPYNAEIRDSSGNGYHGDWQNAATNTIPGQIGQAIDLTGTTSQERFAFTTFDGSHVAGAFTFAGWARLDFLTEALNHQLFQYTDGDQSPSLYYDYPDGDLRFRLRGPLLSISGTTILETTFEPVLGRWYHLTGTFDGTTATVYVDGRLLKNDTVASGVPATPAGYLRGGAGFGGGLDDLRVYNRALTAEEVKDLYNFSAVMYVGTTVTTNPQLEQGLVGHWTFDGYDMDWSSTTAEVRDRSGQGNNGNTAASMNANISTAPGVMGQALYFDGSANRMTKQSPVGTDFSNSYTISAWASARRFGNPLSNCGNLRAHVMAAYKGSPEATVQMYLTGDGTNEWRFAQSNTAVTESASMFTPALLNSWTHLTAVYEHPQRYYTMYINGSVAATVQMAGDWDPINASSSIRVGWGTNCANTEFNGIIDDVRIYNRALSVQEIKRLYDLGR